MFLFVRLYFPHFFLGGLAPFTCILHWSTLSSSSYCLCRSKYCYSYSFFTASLSKISACWQLSFPSISPFTFVQCHPLPFISFTTNSLASLTPPTVLLGRFIIRAQIYTISMLCGYSVFCFFFAFVLPGSRCWIRWPSSWDVWVCGGGVKGVAIERFKEHD